MKELIDLHSNTNINTNFLRKLASVYFTIVVLLLFTLFITSIVSDFITKNLAFEYNDSLSTTEISEDDLEDKKSDQIIVKSGDTFYSIFSKQNIDSNERNKILSALKKSDNNLSIKPGQIITFYYENDKESEESILSEILITIDKVKSISVKRTDLNLFESSIIESVFVKKYIKNDLLISGSFVNTLKNAGFSSHNINQIISAFNSKINFQKNIKEGDKITILSEKMFSEDGKYSQQGKVIFVSLNLSGKEFNLYLFNIGKSQQYLHEDGILKHKAILVKPLKTLRVTSNFGKRRHPILGLTKMHYGVDFGAPRGTPIFSAGDGVVKSIGTKGAYGKIIEIKHNSKLVTAYAHVNRFADNLKIGSRVKQGQIIAYVGSTGRSTAPHLHYEVKINGKHVNPLSIKNIEPVKLSESSIRKFAEYKVKIKRIVSELECDKLVDNIFSSTENSIENTSL